MPVERSSTSLIRHRGVTVKATNVQGRLSNVVLNGVGGERGANPAVSRLTADGKSNAYVDIGQYQSALGFLERRGADPLAAKAMALALLDAATAKGVGVMSLLETADLNNLSILDPVIMARLNQLRDATSQISVATTSSNSQSFASRSILA